MSGDRCVRCRVLAIALIGLAAASAPGGTILHTQPDSLYTGLANQPDFAAVGEFLWRKGGSGYLASGTLINSQWVLTAAHVVSGINPGNIGTMTFQVGGVTYHVSATYYTSGWTGNVSDGNDIGLVQLDSVVPNVTPARLYSTTNESRQPTTIAGFGATGTGLTGATLPAGTKRAGTNVAALGSALNDIWWTGGGNDTMLVADFDVPGPTGDPTQDLAVPTDLEYCAAPGDSGGGWFIQQGGVDYLAGVTSFLARNPANPVGAMYGDIFGSTRVTSFLDWIGQYTTYYTLAPHPGDANDDGAVNVGDLGVLAANWGSTGAAWSTGDFTGEGAVDVGDLGVLAGNWGWTGAPMSFASLTALPEPAALTLLAIGAAVLLRRRSTSRR
jgi:hypothetical protein